MKLSLVDQPGGVASFEALKQVTDTTIDLSNSNEYEIGYIIDVGGVIVPTNNPTWRSYFFPCNKGDVFKYKGRVGDASAVRKCYILHNAIMIKRISLHLRYIHLQETIMLLQN